MSTADDAGSADRELMSAADVSRTIARIAHQIIERPRSTVPTRLVSSSSAFRPEASVLAARLADHIKEFSGVDVGHGSLDITLYRDDLNTKPPRALEDTTIPDGGIDGTLVVLVDDVLYTGRSVRGALDALRDLGRPRRPVGGAGRPRPPRTADPRRLRRQNVPTSRSENVKVRLVESDGHDSVKIAPQEVPPGETPVERRRPVPVRDATAILDNADRFAQALTGREVKNCRPCGDAKRHHDVLRELHPHPGVLRGGGQVDERRHHQRQCLGLFGGQGESLRDTALTLRAAGADALIIRHSASGSAHQLAEGPPSPTVPGPSVINAGDGTHEHPTQALLDALTIRQRLGGLEGKRIVIVGDVPAQPGGPLQRAAARRWAPRSCWSPADAAAAGVAHWPVTVSHDLDAETARRRRRRCCACRPSG